MAWGTGRLALAGYLGLLAVANAYVISDEASQVRPTARAIATRWVSQTVRTCRETEPAFQLLYIVDDLKGTLRSPPPAVVGLPFQLQRAVLKIASSADSEHPAYDLQASTGSQQPLAALTRRRLRGLGQVAQPLTSRWQATTRRRLLGPSYKVRPVLCCNFGCLMRSSRDDGPCILLLQPSPGLKKS